MNFLEKIIIRLGSFKKTAIVLLILLLAGLSIPLLNHFCQSDNSLSVWFAKDDTTYLQYQHFTDTFGSDKNILLAIKTGNPYSQSTLLQISNLTEDFEKTPGIDEVFSITKAQTIRDTNNTIQAQPLINENTQPREIESALNSDDFLRDVFVSKDRQFVQIILTVGPQISEGQTPELIAKIKNIIATHNTTDFHLSGSVINNEAFNQRSSRDQTLFLPLSLLLALLCLALLLKNWRSSLMALGLLTLVLIVVYGIYGLMGNSMNVIIGMLSPILVAVCIADTVHWIEDHERCVRQGQSLFDAGIHTSKKLFVPCFFTALTTVFGFISFNQSQIPPLNQVSLYASIGVLVAFAGTLVLFAVFSTFLKYPKRTSENHQDQKLAGFLERTILFSLKHEKKIALFMLLSFFASLYGMKMINASSNTSDYFFNSDPVKKDLLVFENNLLGIAGFELLFKFPASAEGPTVESLKAMDQLSDFLRHKDPNIITKVFSPVSSIKKIHQILDSNTLPQNQATLSQEIFLAQNSGWSKWSQLVSRDGSEWRISVKTRWLDSRQMEKLYNSVDEETKKLFDPLKVQVTRTGLGPLWVKMQNDLIRTQIQSFALAFLLVGLSMIAGLKNIKMGLVSLIPNVLPILWTMGLMGLFDIPLNVATVMVAGISLGITVDDTIHYLSRFKSYLDKNEDVILSMKQTQREIGSAIVKTGLVLCSGFGILMFGSFTPSVYFGGLVVLTMILSIVCELLLMPILLKWAYKHHIIRQTLS